MTSDPTESAREIVSVRVFPFPREAVFAAFSDPAQLAVWWGPAGFSNRIHAFDLRPGGDWRLTMTGPDGSAFENHARFTVIEPPARIEFVHVEPVHRFRMVMAFEARGAQQTRLTWRMIFDSADEYARVRDFIVPANEQNFDRLHAHLASRVATSPMPATPSTSTDTSDREIVITREFAAPRELVWDAMTDPRHVVNWWGPRGFTTVIDTMDVRVGGTWKHTMIGPDGRRYPNKSIFREVTRPERIVYSHGGGSEDGPGANFVATWTFEALTNQRTRVTIHMVFATAQARDTVVREYGAIEGGRQTLERLSEHVAAQRTPAFEVSRTFAAPRALVWRAWTDQQALVGWFGPKGFTLSDATLDLRPGGFFHYKMTAPDGTAMWGRFGYREIVPETKLVWVNSFSDAAGGITKPPFAGDWPAEILVTASFTEHAGHTTVTITSLPVDATDAEIGTFAENHPSMQQGWGGTLDQLGAFLGHAAILTPR
jgi:uncharacterized protein YndB with AHSA1/START domain